jgi:hypothetical protein
LFLVHKGHIDQTAIWHRARNTDKIEQDCSNN